MFLPAKSFAIDANEFVFFHQKVHGIGKSTFAAQAPSPVFIQTEDGLGMLDCAHFPLAASFDDVIGALAALYTFKQPGTYVYLNHNLIEAFDQLKKSGVTILLVEQNIHFAKRLGDTVAVMDNGRVVHAGSMAALAADEALQQSLLGLSL